MPDVVRVFLDELTRLRVATQVILRAAPGVMRLTRARSEEQSRVLERLRLDARVLARRFGLALGSLDAESPRVKRRYGVCYDDGAIRIRLRHVRTGELLKYSSLVDTLCHEMAHLQHFNHGGRFERLYRRILGEARRRGIYRPTPRLTRAPLKAPSPVRPAPARSFVQLDLFGRSNTS